MVLLLLHRGDGMLLLLQLLGMSHASSHCILLLLWVMEPLLLLGHCSWWSCLHHSHRRLPMVLLLLHWKLCSSSHVLGLLLLLLDSYMLLGLLYLLGL